MNYKKIAFGTLAYFFSSFVVQGLLGFAFAGTYFLGIPILRNPPIVYLALSQAMATGVGFALLYPMTNFKGTPIFRGLKFGLLIGLIVVPLLALDLPARFIIPSTGTWIMAQGILGMLHYAVAGILIGLIYGNNVKEN